MVKVLAYTSTEEYADQDIGNFIFSLQDYLKLFTLSQNARSINIIFVNLESNLWQNLMRYLWSKAAKLCLKLHLEIMDKK